MADLAHIDTADLSPFLLELLELIGFPATMALVRDWGGLRVYIPQQAAPAHRLVQVVGLPAADLLCRYAGGDALLIPRATGAIKMHRNRIIRQRSAHGESAAHLAAAFNLSLRQLRHILADVDTLPRRQSVPPQTSLF